MSDINPRDFYLEGGFLRKVQTGELVGSDNLYALLLAAGVHNGKPVVHPVGTVVKDANGVLYMRHNASDEELAWVDEYGNLHWDADVTGTVVSSPVDAPVEKKPVDLKALKLSAVVRARVLGWDASALEQTHILRVVDAHNTPGLGVLFERIGGRPRQCWATDLRDVEVLFEGVDQ